jgi:cytochrome c-type biogenesis protein CcmH
VPPESEIGRAVQGSIEEATRLAAAAAAGPGAAASAPASTGRPASAPATAATASISGEVSLSPELAGRVAAGDTVYVFARAAEGPRLPLAIVKQAAGSWPLRFTLDDSTAMSPDARLSSATSVVVVARVSRSGNATPQPGDLVGQTAPLSPGSAPVRLVIDRVQP